MNSKIVFCGLALQFVLGSEKNFLVTEADFTMEKSTTEMKRDNAGFRNLLFCCIRRHTIISVGWHCGTTTVMFSSKAEYLHDYNLTNTALDPSFLHIESLG